MNIKRSKFSGSWYPSDPEDCHKEIQFFLKEFDVSEFSNKSFMGGIVPHAGWYFSGSIACNIINLLKNDTIPETIVIFGTHLGPNSPVYIPNEDAYETPFGEINTDLDFIKKLKNKIPFKISYFNDSIYDNTIELQLPFIKYFFNNVKIVPIGVPPNLKSIETAQIIAQLSKDLGINIKVVGSTDLTHYGINYGFIPHGVGVKGYEWAKNQNDAKIINQMIKLEQDFIIKESLEYQNACCPGAITAAITTVKLLGSKKGNLFAYSNSFEKSPGNSFVGYAGVVFN